MKYIAYTDRSGYTFLNGVDNFDDHRQVFAFNKIEYGPSEFSEIWVKERITKSCGYFIKRKGKTAIVNPELDVEQYSVKGIKRGANFYLSEHFAGVEYVDSQFSSITFDPKLRGRVKNLIDHYFCSIGKLLPNSYLATPLNEALGVPAINYTIMPEGICQTVDLDYVSGIQADYYGLIENKLIGAYGIRDQSCLMLPVPREDADQRTINTIVSFLNGKNVKFESDGAEFEVPLSYSLGLKRDPDSGVVFTEETTLQSERFVQQMRSGFKDASGKVVDINVDWCKKRIKPTSSGDDVVGEILYLYKDMAQMRQAFVDDPDIKADGMLYVLQSCDCTQLDADVYDIMCGNEPTRYTGLLVNAGVNAILTTAYDIYRAARAEAIDTFNDVLLVDYERIKSEIQDCFNRVVDDAMTTNIAGITNNGKSLNQVAGEFTATNGEGARIWNFEHGFKVSLPEINKLAGDADGTLDTILGKCGLAVELTDMDPEMSQEMLDNALAHLPKGSVSPEILASVSAPELKLPIVSLYTASGGIKPEVHNALKAQFDGMYINGGLLHLMTDISNVINTVKYTTFVNHQNNTASVSEQWLLKTKKFSRQILPDPLKLDAKAIVDKISIVPCDDQYEVRLTMDVDFGVQGQQGLGTGGSLVSTFCTALQKHMKSEEGCGIDLTVRYLGKVGSNNTGSSHAWYFTDIPTGVIFCYHGPQNCRDYDGCGRNEVPGEISRIEITFNKKRIGASDYVLDGALGSMSCRDAIVNGAESLAAVPFVLYLAANKSTLEKVAEMEPIGYVSDTYMTPRALAAFFNVSWSDGYIPTDEEEKAGVKATGVLGTALNVSGAALLGAGDKGLELYKAVKGLLVNLQNSMVGTLSQPVSKVYWLSKTKFLTSEATFDLGVLPLFIDYDL